MMIPGHMRLGIGFEDFVRLVVEVSSTVTLFACKLVDLFLRKNRCGYALS